MLSKRSTPAEGTSFTDRSCPYRGGDKCATADHSPAITDLCNVASLLKVATVSVLHQSPTAQLRDRSTSLRGPPFLLS